MIAAAYGTVSDIEIVWVTIALVGLVYSLFNAREAKEDLDYLTRAKVANGRRLVARANILFEAARAAIQLIFLSIGILAMLIPEPPETQLPLRQVVIGAVIRWGLIVSSILLTLKSFVMRRVRQVLRAR